jgi:peptidoglycan/xylan/chitin deacetylase (PgdA/CDA1 family)
MKKIVANALLVLLLAHASAEFSFISPDINATNDALFRIQTTVPGDGSYSTLFKKNIDTGSLEQLTFFPESLEALADGSILQIRNRFGTIRYDLASEAFSWIADSRPFYAGGNISFGSLGGVSTSPDGHWLVTVDPVSPARGKLVLHDTVKGVSFVLSLSVPRGAIPVSWAPDSAIMIYEIDGKLYFARPETFFSSSVVDQKYRSLGTGTVRCVSWYSPSRFLYVANSSVYRIQAAELLTRSLYSPLMGPGELAGKLPCAFDPFRDSVCASPDGNAVLLGKDGRSVYYCTLDGDDYVSQTLPAFFPYLLLPGNTANLSFAWTADNIPAVISESVEDGKQTVKAWKLGELGSSKVFSELPVPANLESFAVSPGGNFLAFNTTQGLFVYDASTWKEVTSWKDERVISLTWCDSYSLFVGGAETVRKWNFKSGVSQVLTLSAVTNAAWDEKETSVLADTVSLGRFVLGKSLKWTPLATGKTRPASATNASWRLYVDSGKGTYTNMLYARSAKNPGGTRALVSESAPVSSQPATAVPVSSGNKDTNPSGIFSHGLRTGLSQVSLVFDAMDTLDGLPEILLLLERYGIRATFFVNGEFIREHPAAVNEIVKAGHQCGSLFFTTWDLSGTTFRIDGDFISRGLSRNEDDFFNATGQELTLLWHAPYYVASPDILDAGNKAGYRYISGDVTVLDWVGAEQARTMPGLYRSSSELVEDIMTAVKPGSIIPVRIGKGSAVRSTYLFDDVDLLVNGLVERGYEIVTVDTLINAAANGRNAR